ncbi:MAG: ABC transporter substrate-binding protein [Flavobacteriaceae bacterium]|jgi:hypothetical protein|nr:ABC transporter substrate-binding protein [Flavobacteriaceae bacterium]|tara:strand:- start:6354 stop:8738 length:2385 start_codon:yes stop_codon:yes gene_type:complete
MSKIKLLFYFLIIYNPFLAQELSKLSIEEENNTYSNWESYYSYNYISGIAKGGSDIFFSSTNSIFSLYSVLLQDEKWDTLSGLSGDEISVFYYSSDKNLIAIGYKNGLIQIINLDSNEILNIYDVFNKPTIPPINKKINNFTENNDQLFISTDYGISEYDLNSFEFGDTFYIGEFAGLLNISNTIFDENYIYASSSNGGGIRRATLDSNLIDYNNWDEIFSGSFKGMISNNGKILFYNDQNIYTLNDGQINNVLSLNNEILHVSADDSKIIVTSKNQCLIYDNQFNELLFNINSNDFLTSFNNAIIDENDIYIGTTTNGVLRIENFDLSLNSYLLPNGPLENNIFSVESLNNETWVSYGDYTEYYNPYPLKFNGVSSYNESLNNWINISKDSISDQAVNLNNIAISPFNNSVFISSFHGGLLEFENFIQINFFDESNSDLESLLSSDPQYQSIRVSDIEFDDNGVLWVLNSRIDSPLKSFNLASNNWNSYNFTQIINDGFMDELGFNDIEIDAFGNKWIASLRSGLIGFNENSGTSTQIRKVFSQDQSNMPSSNVKSIAVDNNNHLWIGTIKGLRVLYNTSNFFQSSVISTQQIVILEDGIPRELLEQQYISDIEVDGANNKWVGTIGSGVFYFSPNGQQTIYHFTKENSPLPSNNINDISVNLSSGKVFFATDKGLVSFNSGSSSASDNFSESFVYPNPVRPSFDMQFEKIKISGLTNNVNIKITDIEGNLVGEAQSNVNKRYNGFNLEIDGGTAFWNGKNLRNKEVSSGVYIIMLSDLKTYETKILKLMVVR